MYRHCMFTVNTRVKRENAVITPCTFDGFLPFRFARTGNRLPAVAAVVLRVCGPPARQTVSRPRLVLYDYNNNNDNNNT
jgi:hypothetical protein